MKYLLDSQLLIWISEGTRQQSQAMIDILEDYESELFYSAASLWEITIKAGKGKPSFKVNPSVLRRSLIEAGYEELPLTSSHALAVLALPPLHGDPFDRILVAQASVEGIILLTSDATIAQYSGPIQAI